MLERKLKRDACILGGVLLLGLISYPVMLFFFGAQWAEAETAPFQPVSAIVWSGVAGLSRLICCKIYLIGHICLAYAAVRAKVQFSMKEAAVYFAAQMGVIAGALGVTRLCNRSGVASYTFAFTLTRLMFGLFLIFAVCAVIRAVSALRGLRRGAAL